MVHQRRHAVIHAPVAQAWQRAPSSPRNDTAAHATTHANATATAAALAIAHRHHCPLCHRTFDPAAFVAHASTCIDRHAPRQPQRAKSPGASAHQRLAQQARRPTATIDHPDLPGRVGGKNKERNLAPIAMTLREAPPSPRRLAQTRNSTRTAAPRIASRAPVAPRPARAAGGTQFNPEYRDSGRHRSP